jgi:alpha-ribazole phosphatase
MGGRAVSRLLLVRHAETKQGHRRYWGHSQIGLGEEGIVQAKMLRDHLAGEKIAAIYSSDLKRARRTAEILASVHATEVVLCPELRELDFGQIEGMTFEEVDRRCPEALSLWRGGDVNAAAPAGENLRQLASRVRWILERLQRHSPEETILIVAHSGPLRVLLCTWLGIDLERWWQIRLDPASVSLVETYPEGAVLCFLNNTSHLVALG